MTRLSSHFVFAGGTLLLLLGVFKSLVLSNLGRPGARIQAATIQSGEVKVMKSSTAARMQIPEIFITLLGGCIAVAFADEIGSGLLGATICGGVALYFALEVWVVTTKPVNPRPIFALDTILLIAPAACLIAAAISGVVI
jgi:hypothetical protein